MRSKDSPSGQTFTERARRAQLLSAACELIAEVGYPNTSIARIAERIEVAKGVVLYHTMRGSVHHCGAGTTAAALRAGVPSVPTPGIMDQPFWAKRLHEPGAGTAPIPRRELTAESLADSITEAVSNVTYRASAGSLGERLAAEDGVGNAVRLISNLAY